MSRPRLPFLPKVSTLNPILHSTRSNTLIIQVVRDEQIAVAKHQLDISRINLFLAKQRIQQEEAQRLDHPHSVLSDYMDASMDRANMPFYEREVRIWKYELELLKENEEEERRRQELRGLRRCSMGKRGNWCGGQLDFKCLLRGWDTR